MKAKRLHSCNILGSIGTAPRLWHFTFRNRRPVLQTQKAISGTEPPPPRLVRKSWQALLSPVVNVAWLPANEVFLRVVHLPTDNPDEVPDMIEFQLEKLSPLPVGQIVWNYEIFSANPEASRITVVMVIVERKWVEEYLHGLEERGYLADRLVLPELERLQATTLSDDGAFLFLDREADHIRCLAAWYFGGELRQVNLLNILTGPDWESRLVRDLRQLAWAGEVEGWLQAAPNYRLIGKPESESEWSRLREMLEGPAVMANGAPEGEALAAFTAERTANLPGWAGLIPAEFTARYRQRFIDGLWLRALGALIVVYLIGVGIYLATLNYNQYRVDRLNDQVAELKPAYNRAIQMRAQISVLEKQERLKFAALDAWKAVVEALPPELQLTQFRFSRGEELNLSGTAPPTVPNRITDYKEALQAAELDGRPLFESVVEKGRNTSRGKLTWGLECTLQEALAE